MKRNARGNPVPEERHATIRQALAEALRRGTWTLRELAQELGVRERDLAPHLEHLARSVAHQGEELQIEPATCIACGFAFEGRRRAGRPSRCPRCKSERLNRARYSVR